MIEVKVDNRMVLDALQRLQHATSDMSPSMDAIGNAIAEATKMRFKTGTAPDGSSWKNKKDGNPSRLTEKGTLRNSFSHVFDANSVTVGTNVVYAAIHNFGGSIKHKSQVNAHNSKGWFISREAASKRKRVVPISFSGGHSIGIPARPFFGINNQDETEITNILMRHLIKSTR